MNMKSKDYVRVNDLSLTVLFSDGSCWPSNPQSVPRPQSVLITFSFAHDVRNAAATDDLAHSVNYETLASSITAIVGSDVFPTLEAFFDRVYQVYTSQYSVISSFTVRISRTKALLYGAAFGLEVTTAATQAQPSEETFFLQDILCHAVIGVYPYERQRKQRVRVNISVKRELSRLVPFNFRLLEQRVFDFVEDSKYLTVESLASEVARTVLSFLEDPGAQATVRISKPNALLGAESAEVQVSRTLEDFRSGPSRVASASSAEPAAQDAAARPPTSSDHAILAPSAVQLSLPHRAAIAIGANIGDRFANIESALRLVEAPGADLERWTGLPRVIVVDTSFMYETAPMYVEEQPRFINCACMVETDLEPRELLRFLKDIENAVGRKESYRNGPRAIDLDIIAYDDYIVLDTNPESTRDRLDNLEGELIVPHPRLAEREFVLRPLADMIPGYVVPSIGRTVEDLLATLVRQPTDEYAMYKVIPFPRYPLPNPAEQILHAFKLPPVPLTATYWTHPVTSHPSRGKPPRRKIHIMATLNATPDSFSDGSAHYALPDALSYAAAAVEHGASIIDIGGHSTRPGGAYVSPEEEFTRVVPVVQAIREEGRLMAPAAGARLAARTAHTAATLVSVDTFRWEVAEEAVHAGANCINDVCAFSGGEWPPDTERAEKHFAKMRQVARDLAVPVVLMHSRGPPAGNRDYGEYAYAVDADGRGAVLEGVRVELGARVNKAVRGPGGIRRWLVMVDPGIGFSKTVEGNLELLRDAASLVSDYPPRLRAVDAPAPRPARNSLSGYPLLIGASRKSFLGALLQQPSEHPAGSYQGRQTRPDERDWATAAAVSCAVQQGALAVRVHDVLHLGDVVRVSSALWS